MRKAILFIVVFSVCVGKVYCQAKTFVLATYTYATNDRLKNLEPLANYLSEKTGATIKAISYPTVQALIDAIRKDSVDFAMLNTSGYLVLQKNDPGIIEPLVNLDMGGGSFTNYGGCLITNKQANMATISDLKSKKQNYSLVLVNSSSTSGNLVPRLLLNRAGIPDAELLMQVRYSGTHKKVVEEVLQGNAQVGGCGCAEIDSARLHLDFDNKAIVIDSFLNIPLGPIVYNKKIDPAIVAAIASHLVKLHEVDNAVFTNFCNGWTEFKQATRFQKISDVEYDDFRKLFGSNQKLWRLIE